MQLSSFALPFSICLAVMMTATGAEAHPQYGPSFPNGTTGTEHCPICHTVVPALNVFGNATSLYTPNNLAALWPALCAVDTDGDNIINGEELGDPCCVWTMGAIPQDAIVSNPGDAVDRAQTICDPNATGGTSGGGTNTTGGPSGGNPSGAGPSGGPSGGSIGAGPAVGPAAPQQGACSIEGPIPANDHSEQWLLVAAAACTVLGVRRTRRPR